MTRQEKLWTPGPWSVSTDYATMILVGPSDDAAVCDVETDIDDDGLTVPTPEQNANAQLISAAPLLVDELEMVESLIPATPNVFGGSYMISLSQQDVDQIRAALNAAYGDSQ